MESLETASPAGQQNELEKEIKSGAGGKGRNEICGIRAEETRFPVERESLLRNVEFAKGQMRLETGYD